MRCATVRASTARARDSATRRACSCRTAAKRVLTSLSAGVWFGGGGGVRGGAIECAVRVKRGRGRQDRKRAVHLGDSTGREARSAWICARGRRSRRRALRCSTYDFARLERTRARVF